MGKSKPTEAKPEQPEWRHEIDSKYRLVILAAKRAKQLKKGSRGTKAVGTSVRNVKTLGVPGSISISKIREAVRQVAEEAPSKQN